MDPFGESLAQCQFRRPSIVILATMVLGLLSGCFVPHHLRGGDSCGEIATASPGPAPPAPEGEETLLSLDGTGALRKIRSGRVRETFQIGVPGPGLPPALLAGGGLLWSFRPSGELTLIDPAKGTAVRRV